MVVQWIALPCTTTARNDASNKVRKDAVTGRMKEVFYNYRMTKDKYRRPQHSVGTQKGDDCRDADRLLLAALWVILLQSLDNSATRLHYILCSTIKCCSRKPLDPCAESLRVFPTWTFVETEPILTRFLHLG